MRARGWKVTLLAGRKAIWSRGGRAFLEYDHVVPYALGGRSDDARNIRLLCRAHNQETSRRIFGLKKLSAPGPRAAC